MSERIQVAIVGAGPGGLSAAAHAADKSVAHILLEASPDIANTIRHYQKGKYVMAEPAVLPLRSPLEFCASNREIVLEKWQSPPSRNTPNIRYNAEVTGILGEKNAFDIILKNGDVVQADNIVLATGLQNNLRELGIPGESTASVCYTLEDHRTFHNEDIVIVGAGDTAIENALALAKHNRVTIVNRRSTFARAKQTNQFKILSSIKNNDLRCLYSSTPIAIETTSEANKFFLNAHTPEGDLRIPYSRLIACLGTIPSRNFIEASRIEFPNSAVGSKLELSTRYETNIAGIYIIGALGGYPLIKQCLNQGYEVIEYILGHDLAPADEPLLQKICSRLPGSPAVDPALLSIRKNMPLLRDLTALQLREFLLDSQFHLPNVGQTIFKRGDHTDTFFCILSGGVSVLIGDERQENSITLVQGEFFGELSMISGRMRSAKVTARPDCILLETPRRTMNKLINSVASVRQAIDETSVVRALQIYLTPTTPTSLLKKIAKTCTIHRYATGDTIFSEGEIADSLHIVRKGALTLERIDACETALLAYIPAGDYVGERGAAGENFRNATAKAASETETIELGFQSLKILLSQNAELRKTIETRYRAAVENDFTKQQSARSDQLVAFLINHGVGEATDILLIDESLCVRCDNCETACAETHGGTSRLNRKTGPRYASIHIPTTCRHCSDPHCTDDCPPNAIYRASNGEIHIGNNCIGCGNCEKNCPYGAIQMASPRAEKPGLLQWLLFGRGPGPGGKSASSKDSSDPKRAVKCDMCRDVGSGPACVQACPTGAAIRIEPTQLPNYLNSD